MNQFPTTTLTVQLDAVADRWKRTVSEKTIARQSEMKADDRSHYSLYAVLGIPDVEAERIDRYQNVGRFLYQALGRFVEEAVILCLRTQAPSVAPLRLANPNGGTPRTYSIDALLDQDAIEIKWRDGTTDGDHVAKENAKLIAVAGAGYRPVRLVFVPPARLQARQIQSRLAAAYEHIGGVFLEGDAAWAYVERTSGYDLRAYIRDRAART